MPVWPPHCLGCGKGQTMARINSENGAGFDWKSGAEYLGTSPRHLQRLWAERRISGRKIGRKVRFTQADLDEFLDRNRVEAVR